MSQSIKASFQRRTRQRDAVTAVLEKAEGPLTAPEILERAQGQVGELGIATVYRAVRALTNQGILATVSLPGEPLRFELADLKHHHHFQCRACSAVYDIEGCLPGLQALLPSGFRLEGHDILLTGLCKECVNISALL
jgi:Fur family ferric uptake transcriptional regulator